MNQQPDIDGNKDKGGLTNQNVTRPNPPEQVDRDDGAATQKGQDDDKLKQAPSSGA